MENKMNLTKGGFNCTCMEGYSGKGMDTEVMDVVLVKKPGCTKDGPGVTMFTPLLALVDMLYNSTYANSTNENGTYANSTNVNSNHSNTIESTTVESVTKPAVQDIVIQFVHKEDSNEKAEETKPEAPRPGPAIQNSYSALNPYYLFMISFFALLE